MTLAPFAGEPELGDPAFTGEWAAELAKLTAAAAPPPWCTYIARRDEAPVGLGAFKAPPADGAVEIAYLTFLPAERRGVATGVAAALVGIARDRGVGRVTAHTLPAHNPSTRVLVANGFVMTGAVDDPADGPVWRWERQL